MLTEGNSRHHLRVFLIYLLRCVVCISSVEMTKRMSECEKEHLLSPCAFGLSPGSENLLHSYVQPPICIPFCLFTATTMSHHTVSYACNICAKLLKLFSNSQTKFKYWYFYLNTEELRCRCTSPKSHACVSDSLSSLVVLLSLFKGRGGCKS